MRCRHFDCFAYICRVSNKQNETMKKQLLMLAVLFGLATTYTSCKKNDPTTPAFEYSIGTLHGTWRITHVESKYGLMVNVTDPIAERSFKPTYATFNADGTYSGRGFLGNGSGTYKASGKTITCYIDGKEFMKYDVLSLDGNTCELKMYEPGSEQSIRIRCAKQ